MLCQLEGDRDVRDHLRSSHGRSSINSYQFTGNDSAKSSRMFVQELDGLEWGKKCGFINQLTIQLKPSNHLNLEWQPIFQPLSEWIHPAIDGQVWVPVWVKNWIRTTALSGDIKRKFWRRIK